MSSVQGTLPSVPTPAVCRTLLSRPDSWQGQERAPLRFWLVLGAACALGAVVRVLILREHLAANPFSQYLRVDEDTYWSWAGRIAGGHPSDGHPFFSAPLYPYLLGLVRALGGGLLAVRGSQLVFDLVAAILLAVIARRRYGPATGLLAAALYLLMREPAAYSLRVLAATLQMPLVCLAWLALLRLQERPSMLRSVVAGAALGLLSLTFPPAIVAVPALAVWHWWGAGRTRRALVQGVVGAAAGLGVISPATIYNYRACGEFIPISAQAGVTFAQGNAPGADGGYTELPGISADRDRQNLDAMRVYQQATGGIPSWRAVDRFFFKRGLDFWRFAPGQAAALLATKAYYFLTGRHYGEIVLPSLEIEYGFLTRLRWTPVHTAWLIPPAIVALAVWLRHPLRYGPEWMLFAVPLATVVLFFYSPRYRFPAIPVIVVGATWALVQAAEVRRRWRWTVSAAGALLATVFLTLVNRATGFDSPNLQRPLFEWSLGVASGLKGQWREAVRHCRAALALRPDYDDAEVVLASALQQLGCMDESAGCAQRVLARDPNNAVAHNIVGLGLVAQGRVDEATGHFRRAVELNPTLVDARVSLGNVLSDAGAFDEARRQYRAALEIKPSCAAAHYNLGLLELRAGEPEAAARSFRQTLALDPAYTAARMELARLLRASGRFVEAGALLREGCRLNPADVRMVNNLAWLLATCPVAEVRDGAEATRLALEACRLLGAASNAAVLDTLAAAQAETGQFEEAAKTAREAAKLAARTGEHALAEEIRARLQLYEQRQPYRTAPPDLPASSESAP